MKKLFMVSVLPAALGLAFFASPAAMAQGQWYELTPSDQPDSRHSYDMAADGTNHIILFGGRVINSSVRNDTWSWDGADWTELAPAASPPVREAHTMSHDPVRDRIVLFSGWDGYSYLPDTWEWDGTTWLQTAPAVTPPERDYSEMVYDPNTGTTLMFGGHDWWQVFNGVGTYGDLWSWDGAGWTQLSPVNLPPPRHGHCMVFDKNRGTVILFGGVQEFPSGASLLHNDMWEWDGSDWTQIFPGTLPPERILFSMAYDDARNVVVLHGGLDPANNVLLDDTWEWDGSAWTQAPSTGPAYGWMSAAYDATRQEILIQGGATSPDKSTADDKTWAYTARTLFPVLDIKCNGEDANVVVALFLGPPEVTIDVEARDGMGYPVDLFCAIKAPSGAFYTFNGISWQPGLFSAYYTGPLMDMSDTILNMNVPLGSYEAYLAMDIIADGVLQLTSVFDHDMVDFTITP